LQSRDKLKAKYRAVKVELKRLRVRVADVSKSRDMWKQRAEFSEQQLRAMHAEVERLTAAVEPTEALKKKAKRNPV
jgi:capsule polysaccharide export protein KpsE/RkpR